MKSFREQFSECRDNGTSVEGDLMKFREHPEILPHPLLSPKAAKAIVKLVEKDPDAGVHMLVCRKFGGRCSSGNPACRLMRASLEE